MAPATAGPLAALAAAVCLGAAAGPALGSGATAAFHSVDGGIACVAQNGAQGSGIECTRLRDGLVAAVRWNGVFVYRLGGGGAAAGWVLRPGRPRVVRMPDVAYRCTAPSRSAVRCENPELGRGVLIGPGGARRVTSGRA